MFGPSLYATHDGGLHWTAVSVPGTVSALEPGLGEVFATVTPSVLSCGRTGTCDASTPAPHIYRTLPGSNHWTLDPAAGSVSVGLAVHGRSIWIIDSRVTADGPAFGTVLWSYCSGGHFESTSRSVDAGAHFTTIGPEPNSGTSTPNGYPNGSSLQAASPAAAVAASSTADGPVGD